MSLRVRAEDKATLLRAVALEHTDLTDFVLRPSTCLARRRSVAATAAMSGAETFLVIDDADNKTILGFYSVSPAAV